MSAFALPGESRPSIIRVQMNETNVNKFHLS